MAYLVDGPQHCFTYHELYYTADAMGPDDDGETNSGLMLSDWTNIVPLSTGEAQNTVCEGYLQEQEQEQKVKATGDNDYCSTKVVPKQFVEQY